LILSGDLVSVSVAKAAANCSLRFKAKAGSPLPTSAHAEVYDYGLEGILHSAKHP